MYTETWLKEQKAKKEMAIVQILENCSPEDCILVKYSSAIKDIGVNVSEKQAIMGAFNAGLFAKDNTFKNLEENNNKENIDVSTQKIDELFNERIQPLIDNKSTKPICLFAIAPQPLLIYLGVKFGDKSVVHVFTRTLFDEESWLYRDKEEPSTFNIEKPIKINNENNIVLLLNSTNTITEDRIPSELGNVDIWSITARDIGRDKISGPTDLQNFSNAVVAVLDEIGNVYGKKKEINVLPLVCNSLAVTFGRAIFTKSHNKINIYDAVADDNGDKVYTLRLSI
jgi:hypothetical protein